LSFKHHNVDSPYRASGPIFVREHARIAQLTTNQIPTMFHNHLLSVRAYGIDHNMIGAEVTEGTNLASTIEQPFKNPTTSLLHIHNANPGCFNCV